MARIDQALLLSTALSALCALGVALAPRLVPQSPDAFPLLLVAVAFAGTTAGWRGAAASLAIVVVEALWAGSTPGRLLVFDAPASLRLVVVLASAPPIGVMCAAVHELYVRERWALVALNDQLRRMTVRDALTGLANRRGFEQELEAGLSRTSRRGGRFSLLWADVDDLKTVNDTRGHPSGDAVLESFASALRQHCRTGDVAARIGGDEFAMILGESDASGAREVAQRVLASYRALVGPRVPGMVATVSFGQAAYPTDGTTRDQLFRVADRRLYESKASRATS